MRMKAILGLLILSVIFSVTACGKKQDPAQAEARVQTVSVYKVEKGDMVKKLSVSGKILPQEEVKVVPKAAGKVARVNCDVGLVVTAGSILLELDNTDIQVKLDTARATLAMNEANLAKAGLQLEKNQIQVDDAKRNFDRKKVLFDGGAVSQADYETARSSYESARKDYEMNAAALISSRATVDQSRASVRQNEVDLENTFVRSPISGIVSARSVNAGEYVTNSTAAVVVVNIDTVEVNTNLLEDEINSVKQGMDVDVAVAAVSKSPLKGKVTKISPSADSKSKTYPIWVSIPNPGGSLKPGMFAEIQVVVSKREGVLSVPPEAVVERGGKKVAYVVDGDKALEKPVTPGIAQGGKIEVSGLNEGDILITTGLQTLKTGTAIKVQAPAQDKGK